MAIDPPYRLDPFQNIVNVHWQSAGGIFQQVFVWRRWPVGSPPANAYEGTSWNGDWYPVSDEFWATAYAAGDAAQPKIFLYTVGYRTKLSDLITAAMTLSSQYGNSPGGNSFTFNRSWFNLNSVKGAWPITQPSRTPGYNPVYSGVCGVYEIDDMGTDNPMPPDLEPV